MALFQQSIIKKYLQELDCNSVNSAFDKFYKHFGNTERQNNIRELKEEQYQEGFLRELFVNILGYTINPEPNYNLLTEQKNEKDSKKADGAIIIQGADAPSIIAVIELKGTDTTDLSKVENQAFGYKNNQKDCKYVIISNFEKLRFYIDNAIDFEEFNLFNLTKERFQLLYLCLSKENLLTGIPQKIKEASVSQEENITKKLYSDYSTFKRTLYQNLVDLNPQYDKLTLFKKTQKLLDRFLFIFFAEDRLLLPPNSIREIIKQWNQLKELDNYTPLYDRFKKYFGYMNTGFKGKQYEIFAYNGGFFAPDEILDNIKIDDAILYDHTLRLSNYDFDTEVDVNILGHIFEHSLNEIEEIQSELEGKELDKSKTKRKKDGVFYTPKYITKYIVENTVGALCTEKKKELEINDEEIVISKRKDKKKELIEKIDNYRNWLLKLTICDPACGSGAFLNQALDYLLIEHKKLDELKARITNSPMIFSDIENSVLENNIFGVDLNDEAVEIARLSLWLKTAQKGRKLSDLSKNIKCGNSLIDDKNIAVEKAFNWQYEFSEIFANGGFDVVIGNPPYFNIETLGVNSSEANFIKCNYPLIWQDKSDILFYFIYKAMCISKSEIGFIVSNAFLFSDKAKKLRNIIIDDSRLSKIINFEKYKVFDDASITSCIIIFNKNYSTLKAIVLKDKDYSISEINNTISNNNKAFDVCIEKDSVFALASDKIRTLNNKIDNNHPILRDVFIVGSGMQTGANNVFTFEDYPSQFPCEYIRYKMSGEIISRYCLNNKKEFLLYVEDVDSFEELPKSIQTYLELNKTILTNRADKKRRATAKWWNYTFAMHKEYYSLNKIWCPYRSQKNKFILDETSNYIGLTNTTVIFETNPNYSIKYVLSLLNSNLLSYRYKFIGKQTGSGVFEYFENGVGKIPIPQIPISEQLLFIEKVDVMNSKNKELLELKAKFLKLLTSKYSELIISYKLKSWIELDYKEFSKELEKQKLKLSLSEQSEWLDFFEKEKSKAIEFQNEINKTDIEIDKMVFELYGLSEDEIKIVEGN